MPMASAMDRVDQWVASAGLSSRVFTITASTLSSVTVRGRPRPGFVEQPVEAHVHEPPTPLADGGAVDTQVGSDRLIGGARCTGQHDPSS